MSAADTPDIVIIGSGMGGATLAAGLAPSGARIVVLERGQQIPDDAPARDPWRVYGDSAFKSPETWLDGAGNAFSPGNYYNVGGNSKLYGAVLMRYRAEDFAEMAHLEGVSPAWPFGYETMAPWYDLAEAMYQVRGDATGDPTEPPHGPYPHPPSRTSPPSPAPARDWKRPGFARSACRWGSTWTSGWRRARPAGTAIPTPAAARWTPRPAAWSKPCATPT